VAEHSWDVTCEMILGDSDVKALFASVGCHVEADLRVRKLSGEIHDLSQAEGSSGPRGIGDRTAFLRALDELDRVCDLPSLPQDKSDLEGIKAEVQVLRGLIESGDGRAGARAEALCRRANLAFGGSENPRRDQLMGLLRSLASAKSDPGSATVEGITADATTFVESPWMHAPWLQRLVVAHMLRTQAGTKVPSLTWGYLLFLGAGSALFLLKYRLLGLMVLAWTAFAFCKDLARRRKAAPLLAIGEAVRQDRFDGPALARRLRALESKGLFVNDLVFRVLEPPAPAGGREGA
jgi:hypothetical protein